MRVVRDGARYKPTRRRLRIPSDIHNVKEQFAANDAVSELLGPDVCSRKLSHRRMFSRGAEAVYRGSPPHLSNPFVMFF